VTGFPSFDRCHAGLAEVCSDLGDRDGDVPRSDLLLKRGVHLACCVPVGRVLCMVCFTKCSLMGEKDGADAARIR